MELNQKLYAHQIKAMQDIQENGQPVGRVDVLCSMLGRSMQASGKINQLQLYLHSLPAEERERFLANVRIVAPMGDTIATSEQLAEMFREAQANIRKSMHVIVSPDVHIAALSGGGRSIPSNYDARYYTTPKNLVICSERPNTTDMFRMFRDGRNKPKRGKK